MLHRPCCSAHQGFSKVQKREGPARGVLVDGPRGRCSALIAGAITYPQAWQPRLEACCFEIFRRTALRSSPEGPAKFPETVAAAFLQSCFGADVVDIAAACWC